jgi:hypothetical protein
MGEYKSMADSSAEKLNDKSAPEKASKGDQKDHGHSEIKNKETAPVVGPDSSRPMVSPVKPKAPSP